MIVASFRTHTSLLCYHCCHASADSAVEQAVSPNRTCLMVTELVGH